MTQQEFEECTACAKEMLALAERLKQATACGDAVWLLAYAARMVIQHTDRQLRARDAREGRAA